MSASEPRFGLGKSVLYSAILITFFLGLAEGAVRTWAHYLRGEVERFDADSGTFVLIPGEHRTAAGRVRVNPSGFVGAPLEPRGEDLWRIVALGDSCTFGGGNEVDTYPAMLDVLLDARDRPGRRYEVVNAGISGLNSDLALRRLRTVVPPLEPRVVTIYVGWNDLMKVDPAGQQQVGHWSGVARFLDQLWLARGLRKLLFFHVRPRVRPPRTGPESRTGAFADFVPDVYEANLRSIVEEVRRQEARPLLVTLPTVVREDMTVEDLRAARVVFPYFPSAYGVGDLLDLVASYNRVIEQVGREMGVPVLDLADRFREIEDPTPFFYDTMHTNTAGMGRIAGYLEEALDQSGLLGTPALAASSPD